MAATVQNQYRINSRLRALIPWVLGVILLLVLALNLPTRTDWRSYAEEAVLFASLTTVVLLLSVRFGEFELSPAHVIGIMALLSLPDDALPLLTWTMATGAVAGATVIMVRERSYTTRPPLVNLRQFIFLTSRVTLSFFAAGTIYTSVDAPLPIYRIEWQTQSDIMFYLLIYVLVYTTLYYSIFTLEMFVTGKGQESFISQNLTMILVTLLLPVPFAILSAETWKGPIYVSDIIAVLGLSLVIVGLRALSLSQNRLHRQLTELRAISEVSQEMRVHLDLEKLLQSIYGHVSSTLRADNFIVVLKKDGDGQYLEYPIVVRHGTRYEITNNKHPVLMYFETLLQQVLDKNVPLVVNHDVRTVDTKLISDTNGETIYSWMGVPLRTRDHHIGVMVVSSNDPVHRFEDQDLRLLNVLAGNASFAIETAQLYQEQQLRLQQLNTFNAVAPVLTGTLSSEGVLDTVISAGSAIDQANAVAVYMFMDENSETLSLIRTAGLSSKFMTRTVGPALPLVSTAPLHLAMPLAIGNINDSKISPPLKESLASEEKAAFVELPMVIGEQATGVLALYYDERQYFDVPRLELLRSFATQAAQAINNARRYTSTDAALQRSIERLMALSSIGRSLISQVSLNAVCNLILASALDLARVRVGMVALYDADGDEVKVIASFGYPENTFEHIDYKKTLSFQAVLKKEYINVGDVSQADDYKQLIPATASQLTVPIVRTTDVIGFITLESDQAGHFAEADARFIAQIADQAVIAIDNARLFERILEGRDRLQIILDTMDEALIMVDSRGEVALANFRVELIGLDVYQIQGRKVKDLLEDTSLRFAERTGFPGAQDLLEMTRDMAGISPWQSNPRHAYRLTEEDSALHLERHIIPVPDDVGQTMGLLMVFYDKTQEFELNRARDEFSKMIIHDLRSPLTAVTTGLRLLRTVIPKESDHYPIVERTTDASSQAIQKLLARVDSLLDIARMQTGRLDIDPQPVDLKSITHAVHEQLSPLAQDHEIALETDLADALPELHVDVDKVERLLINLVDNALKYSPKKSTVRIRARAEASIDGAVPQVRIDVIDNGPGIPQSYREQIFDQFIQVEGRQKVRRGVGLGLTFCKLVVEAHGGQIWIEDNPTGGSIFAFTLPVKPATDLS